MRRGVAVAVSILILTIPARAARGADSVTIRLTAAPLSFRTVDTPPKGQPNKGDMAFERTTLRNAVRQFGRPQGAIVGRDYAVYTILSRTTLRVTVVATLPGGTLRVQSGVLSADTTFRSLPVVDGTGTFENARGTLEVAPLSNTRVRNVYRLQLP